MAAAQAADQLAVCQQTNALTTQAERNTRDIIDAVQAQTVMINDKFCDLEKRELQDKINSLTADNALLRANADNAAQTAFINEKFNTVQNGIFTLNNAITSVGTQVGMSGLQIQNALQAGNASIASQICQCCCENRLAICQQTNTLQS